MRYIIYSPSLGYFFGQWKGVNLWTGVHLDYGSFREDWLPSSLPAFRNTEVDEFFQNPDYEFPADAERLALATNQEEVRERDVLAHGLSGWLH